MSFAAVLFIASSARILTMPSYPSFGADGEGELDVPGGVPFGHRERYCYLVSLVALGNVGQRMCG